MEDVLDVYTAAYDPNCPLICMDESSKTLHRDVQSALPLEPGKPCREDYHYERRGTASIFMFFDPLRGWRRASVRDSRMRIDWAEEIRRLLDDDYPDAKYVKLVCDNLNTHHIASLYTAFEPAEARRLARRLRMHHTPRNGSWLNMAEIELSIVQRQCLNRRIDNQQALAEELTAWQDQRNAEGSTVHWRMTTDDARIKLRKLYPTF